MTAGGLDPRSPIAVVMGHLRCDQARAGRVLNHLKSVMQEPDVRAFMVMFCEVNGLASEAAKLTPETAFLHIGRREVGLFLLRVAQLAGDPSAYATQTAQPDAASVKRQ